MDRNQAFQLLKPYMGFYGVYEYEWCVKTAIECLPTDVLSTLRGKLAFYSTICRDACRIGGPIREQYEVILLSEHIFPTNKEETSLENRHMRYFIFATLHEIAHVFEEHKPPSNISTEENDDQEREADKLALGWFSDYVASRSIRGLKSLDMEEVKEARNKNLRIMKEKQKRVTLRSATNPSFSDRLITRLTQTGMTKEDLAGRIGVEMETIVPYLRGQVPDAETLYRIAKALDTTMEWLIAGE